MMNEQNDKQEQEGGACGPGCSCGTTGGNSRMKWVLCGVVALAAVVVMAAYFSRTRMADGQGKQQTNATVVPPVATAVSPGAVLSDAGVALTASSTQSAAAGAEVALLVDQVKKEGKYVCLLLYKQKNAKLDSFQNAVEDLNKKQAGKAELVMADALAATSKDILKKYGIDPARMPMPLLMTIAPNGAVTGMFAAAPDEQKLAGAILSEKASQCVKALQDGKIVMLCIQGPSTIDKEKAMAGVDALLADKTYTNVAGKVVMDPDEPGDKGFIGQFNTRMTTNEAVTIVLAPPGKIAATFKGSTSKAALAKAVASCGSSCAPGAS
jgi:hypothetical protein